MKECDNGMESDKSEYIGGAEAYRPQTPTDAKVPQGSWTPGKPPVG